MKSEIQGVAGDIPVFGKAMHDPADRIGPLLPHQAQRVGGGLTGMDDQGFAAGLRSPDVRTETFALPFRFVFCQ